jgi:hypothetical protein
MIFALEKLDIFEHFLVDSFGQLLSELAREFFHEFRYIFLGPILTMPILKCFNYGLVEL